jgi:hypothetical protein
VQSVVARDASDILHSRPRERFENMTHERFVHSHVIIKECNDVTSRPFQAYIALHRKAFARSNKQEGHLSTGPLAEALFVFL